MTNSVNQAHPAINHQNLMHLVILVNVLCLVYLVILVNLVILAILLIEDRQPFDLAWQARGSSRVGRAFIQ